MPPCLIIIFSHSVIKLKITDSFRLGQYKSCLYHHACNFSAKRQVLAHDFKELKRLRGNRPFKYIVIDTLDVVKDNKNQEIDILKMPYPSKDYEENWWQKEHYKSEAGKNFEQEFCNFCKKGINDLLNSCKSL